MSNRPCKVFKWDIQVDPVSGRRVCNGKVELGPATFLQFGVNYEECNDGVGSFSTALVEWHDGTISNEPVGLVQFTDKGETP